MAKNKPIIPESRRDTVIFSISPSLSLVYLLTMVHVCIADTEWDNSIKTSRLPRSETRIQKKEKLTVSWDGLDMVKEIQPDIAKSFLFSNS